MRVGYNVRIMRITVPKASTKCHEVTTSRAASPDFAVDHPEPEEDEIETLVITSWLEFQRFFC